MKWTVWAMMIVTTLAIAGCSPTTTTAPGGSFCGVAEPIRYGSQEARDAVFDFPELDRAIISHNEKGRDLCGW